MFCNHNFPWSHSESEQRQNLCPLSPEALSPTEQGISSIPRVVGPHDMKGHELKILPFDGDHWENEAHQPLMSEET